MVIWVQLHRTDMEKLDAWFKTHYSFDQDILTLRILSVGFTAGDGDINCDDAEVLVK